MKSVKTKKIFVSALFALSLFFGISAATLMKNNSAAAEVSAAIEVVGAAVRYPEATESAPKGTGLKFEVKLSNVAIESVVNLGVLVDKEGVPTTALTGDKHIKFIENGVASSENKYTVKDNDVYMYVSLVHVPKNYFHNEFVCCAYYQTETGEVVYSNTLERSVTYVIKEAIADETGNAPTAEQKALLEKLRNASEDHTYTASYGEIVTPATDAAQGTRKAFCTCGKEGVAPIGLYHYQFDTDGGIPVEGIDRFSYDTISELPTPERSGAEFLGWYNEAGEKVEKIDVPYAEGVTGEMVTLKAKWLVYLTEEELAAGYSFDGAEKIGRVKANSADTVISYDETKNAMAIAQGGGGESRLLRLSGLISLKKGESVHLLMDSYNSTNNGGGLRIMYSDNTVAKSQEIKRTAEGFAYLSWTADRDYDNVYIGYINYVNTTYYLRCIAVAKTQNLTIAQLEAGYTFDNPAKVLGKMACLQGSAQYDLEKNAMKLTQWGGSLAINVDTFTLKAGDSIVIAYSSDTKGGFSLSGTYIADIPANGTEFIWKATKSMSISSVGLKSYTQNKDLYVVSIQVVRSPKISAAQLESGFAFDDSTKIATYTTCEADISATYDAEKNAMLIKPSANNKTVSINVDTITLNAGDKIVVKVWCLISSPANASFVTTADGTKSYTNILENTGFQEYVYTAAAECTVTDLQIIPYTASGELYVQSIQIVRANAN